MEQEALSNLGIRLIIYGSPDALTTNRTQLDLILEHLKKMNRTDQLLYTINFSSYPRFIRSIIKGQMKSNSEEVGIRIYADWDGVLSSHFNLDNSQVSFFLIEDIGVIQERFYFNDALTALDILAKIVR